MAGAIVLSRPMRRVAYGLTKAVRASLRWREHLPPFAVAASSVLLRQLANVGSWTASSAVVARLGRLGAAATTTPTAWCAATDVERALPRAAPSQWPPPPRPPRAA